MFCAQHALQNIGSIQLYFLKHIKCKNARTHTQKFVDFKMSMHYSNVCLILKYGNRIFPMLVWPHSVTVPIDVYLFMLLPLIFQYFPHALWLQNIISITKNKLNQQRFSISHEKPMPNITSTTTNWHKQ